MNDSYKPLPRYSRDIEITTEDGGLFPSGGFGCSRPMRICIHSRKYDRHLMIAVASFGYLAEAIEQGLRQMARAIGEIEVFGMVQK